jgi:hypothetical protein
MADDIKYSDNQEDIVIKEKRIIITKNVEVVENVSLRDLEQQLIDIEQEQVRLDNRKITIKNQIAEIGVALNLDVQKEIPRLEEKPLVEEIIP